MEWAKCQLCWGDHIAHLASCLEVSLEGWLSVAEMAWITIDWVMLSARWSSGFVKPLSVQLSCREVSVVQLSVLTRRTLERTFFLCGIFHLLKEWDLVSKLLNSLSVRIEERLFVKNLY